jgi:predicted AlkP superfamily pyrophosphatase or phosphodiesterase
MRFAALLFVVVAACAPRGGMVPTPPTTNPSVVVLVSIDGFRADYLARGVTPVLDSLARVGVRAEWLEPSFPTKTFPNHYTIVTGLRPDHHGIISNNIWDDELGRFAMSIRSAVQDARWWGGEPIWVTAEKAGRPVSAVFWPGSEAPIGGMRPTHWWTFDDKVPLADRVDSTLAWIDVPAADRPAVLTLYASPVDHAGHRFGPQSPLVSDSLRAADAMLRRLSDGLHRRGLADQVNIIVVSDHGMSETSPDRVIALDDYISLDDVRINDWTPVAMIAPKAGRDTAVYRALKGAHPALDVYWKDELPARLAFGTNPRVPAIIAIAHDGWTITSRARAASVRVGGDHGYDNALPSMRALFVASGPAFRRGVVVPAFSNVDVYPLMTHILGITPAPNDGELKPVAGLLRDGGR